MGACAPGNLGAYIGKLPRPVNAQRLPIFRIATGFLALQCARLINAL
jgi:hypothetical protein